MFSSFHWPLKIDSGEVPSKHSLEQTYLIFLLDQRLVFITTSRYDGPQIGVACLQNMARGEALGLNLLSIDLGFATPPEGSDVLDDGGKLRAWHLEVLGRAGLSDESLNNARDPTRTGGLAVLVGPGRFLNVSLVPSPSSQYARCPPFSTRHSVSKAKVELKAHE